MPNRKGISDREDEICKSIIDKIVLIVNISEGNHVILGEFSENKIKESMLNDAVTNIWIKNIILYKNFESKNLIL